MGAMTVAGTNRPTGRCSLCGTVNLSGTTTCERCGTVLPPFGTDEPRGWRAMLGDRPASGARALLALPFFLVAAFAAGALGFLPFIGLMLLLGGASFRDAFLFWAVWSFIALIAMLAAAGLAFVIRGRED